MEYARFKNFTCYMVCVILGTYAQREKQRHLLRN